MSWWGKQRDIFESAKLKLERAKSHISDLNRKVTDFLKLNPYKLVIEPDSTSPHLRVAFRERVPIPDEFALIGGDAIHNLRAALDHLAVAAVRQAGKDTADVYFPFAKDGDSLQAAIEKRHIDRAGPQVVQIIKTLKPYKGGNIPLRRIHDLDINDKHTGLIVTRSFVIGADRQIFESRGAVIGARGMNAGFLIDGMTCLWLTEAGDFKIGDEIDAPCFICLMDGNMRQLETFVPLLYQLLKTAQDVVSEFERAFSA